MKALSMYSLFAMSISCYLKVIEVRSWETSYRGDILICSSLEDSKVKSKKDMLIFGKALAVAEIVDCVPYVDKEHRELAMVFDDEEIPANSYSFLLDNIRPIKPIDVKGKQRLFNIDIDNIEYLDIDSLENSEQLEKYWLDNGYIKELPWE